MKTEQSPNQTRSIGEKLGWLHAFGQAFLRPFRGSASGASLVEFLVVAGFVSLFAIGAMHRYGRVVHAGLRAEASRIEGKGLPSTADLLSDLGGNTTPPACDIESGRKGLCVEDSGFCFGAGTPVATEYGDRPIEYIRAGERVWAQDVETGATELRPVVRTFVTRDMQVMDLQLQSFGRAEHITVTPGHYFWSPDHGWTQAQDLGGASLLSLPVESARDGPTLLALPLASKERSITVYNLEVEGFHTYFVGHSHALVHNAGGKKTCPLQPDKIASIRKAGVPQGGSYYQVRNAASHYVGADGKEISLGGEVNHMPAWDSWVQSGKNPFTHGTAPAIWMETADHRAMTSTGSSAAAKAYRAKQAKLIKQGKIMEAIQMDIDEIHKKYGSKYDQGIQEMLDYLATKGIT
ncbi:MAG TPA: polymorphic toxin-type HINT domain-containing protein [Polyangiaceae bacterium]|nr:polymorphic toxin-type HINT domain-containing protein [Polyangiaceae bacterium]